MPAINANDLSVAAAQQLSDKDKLKVPTELDAIAATWRANTKITEGVVVVDAANLQWGKAILKLLFDRHGAQVPITEEVIKTAIENGGCGERISMPLWHSHPDLLKITLSNSDVDFEKLTETLFRFHLGRDWVYLGSNREPIWS